MRSSSEAYFILGCMDRTEAYALPLAFVEEHLNDLNQTEKEDKHYWHIALTFENGHLALNVSSIGKKFDITPYKFDLN